MPDRLTAELIPDEPAMKTAVYVTEGGSRYHSTRACNAFLGGQWLWRFDPMEWVPGMPQIMLTSGHRLDEMTATDALGRGKEPCASCLPGQRAALHCSSSEDDFGHEPTWINAGYCGGCDRCGDLEEREVCARCVRLIPTTPGPWPRASVDWPCTSAVVLGLVPRTDEQAAALRKVVHGCETPETHNWGCPCETTPAP